MPVEELALLFREAGIEVQCAPEGVQEAIEMAELLAGPRGVVVATGSMFVAAEAIRVRTPAGSARG